LEPQALKKTKDKQREELVLQQAEIDAILKESLKQRFLGMIHPDFDETKPDTEPLPREIWNNQNMIIGMAKSNLEFRFTQTPRISKSSSRTRRILKNLITKEKVDFYQLVPDFISPEVPFQIGTYYYINYGDVLRTPDFFIRTVLYLTFKGDVSNIKKLIKAAEPYVPEHIKFYAKKKQEIENMKFEKAGAGSIDKIHQNYQTTQLLTNHGICSIHSNFHDWDFGMSFELMTLLGLVKQNNHLPENFFRRQLYRYWLNGIIRDCQLDVLDQDSLIHYYTTGLKLWGDDSLPAAKKQQKHALSSKENDLLPGSIIYKYGKLFVDVEESDRLNFTPFKESGGGRPPILLWKFFKEELGITTLNNVWSSVIARTKSKSIIEVLEAIPPEEFGEYLRFFYGRDKILTKLLDEGSKKMYPLHSFDLLGFMLWYCFRGMPLDKQIISEVPPKLNPYTEFWIYSDIIKEEVVSTGFGKLLAMCTTPQNVAVGEQAEVTYNFPLFKNLSTKIIDEIEIFIAGRTGKPIPFIDGPSTVQLLFQARDD